MLYQLKKLSLKQGLKTDIETETENTVACLVSGEGLLHACTSSSKTNKISINVENFPTSAKYQSNYSTIADNKVRSSITTHSSTTNDAVLYLQETNQTLAT